LRNLLALLRNVIFSKQLLHQRLNSWLHREMFFLFFSLQCINSITFYLQIPHMDWNIDSFLPLESLNCIVEVFIVLFWQMEYIPFFQCQIPIWSVIPNACGNLKCACNHHGYSFTCLCTFCQFLESWGVWLLIGRLITCSIVGIMLVCGLMTYFNAICSFHLQLIKAVNSSWSKFVLHWHEQPLLPLLILFPLTLFIELSLSIVSIFCWLQLWCYELFLHVLSLLLPLLLFNVEFILEFSIAFDTIEVC
jgi:hypothetical protein